MKEEILSQAQTLDLAAIQHSRGDRIRPLNMQDIVSIRDQMQPQEIQLANFDPVQVSSAQYDFIVNHLAGIKDKAEMEAEEIRIASALSLFPQSWPAFPVHSSEP